MDFTSDVSSLTDEQILAYCANSIYLTEDITGPLAPWKNKDYPHDVSFVAVFARFRTMQRREAQKEVHLRARAALLANSADVALHPTTITYKLDGATVVAPIQRGYAVEPGRGLDLYKSQVVDAMAYMYTPPKSAGPIRADIANNFESGVAAAAIPRMTTPTTVQPREWSHDFSENVRSLMQSVSTMKGLTGATEKLKAVYTADPPLSSSSMFEMKGQTPLPKAFTPKITRGVKDQEMAYRVLAAHRAARGIDKKWISPLTANYYYGVFDKTIDRVLWEASDVLSVARVVGASSIFVCGKNTMKYSAYLSLAASGYSVYVQGNDLLSSPVPASGTGAALPGVYVASVTTVPPPGALIVRGGPPDQIIVSKNGVEVPESVTETLVAFSKLHIPNGCHAMTWTFLHDEMMNVGNIHFYPSSHVHAGHVLVYLGPVTLPAISLSTYYNRFSVSNCFKTWFPLTRVRFMEYDLATYGVKFPSYWGGFTLRMRPLRVSNKYDYFGAMDVAEVSSTFTDTSEIKFNTPIEGLQKMTYEPPKPIPSAPPPANTPTCPPPPDTGPAFLDGMDDADFASLGIADVNDNPI